MTIKKSKINLLSIYLRNQIETRIWYSWSKCGNACPWRKVTWQVQCIV